MPKPTPSQVHEAIIINNARARQIIETLMIECFWDNEAGRWDEEREINGADLTDTVCNLLKPHLNIGDSHARD